MTDRNLLVTLIVFCCISSFVSSASNICPKSAKTTCKYISSTINSIFCTVFILMLGGVI